MVCLLWADWETENPPSARRDSEGSVLSVTWQAGGPVSVTFSLFLTFPGWASSSSETAITWRFPEGPMACSCH